MLNSPNNIQVNPQLLLISFQQDPNFSTENQQTYYPKSNNILSQNQGLIRSPQVKIALAISTISEILHKYKSSKLQTYLYTLIIQYKRLTLLQKNSRKYYFHITNERITTIFDQKNYYENYKCIQKVMHDPKIVQSLKMIIKITYCKTQQFKFSAFFRICAFRKFNYSLRDESHLQFSFPNVNKQKEEKWAIKFASTTLIINAINSKVLLQKLQFCFFLNFIHQSKQRNILREEQRIISPSNFNKSNDCETAERKFKSLCLLNLVLKKKIMQYLLILKIHAKDDKLRRTSFTSSILNSTSIILDKFLKKGEMHLEQLQSTNDTELSKSEIDDFNIKKKTKYSQTFQELPQIINNKQTIKSSSHKLLNSSKIITNLQYYPQKASIMKKKSIIGLCFGILLLLMVKVIQ